MSATLAALERRLLRGLDADTQGERHDAAFMALLSIYMKQVDQERGTCRRRDRVGAALEAQEMPREDGAALGQQRMDISAGVR